MSSKCTAAKAYDILGIYDFPDDFDALNGLHSYFYASNDMVVEALASQKYDLARDIVTAIETVDKDGSYDDCAFYVSRDGVRARSCSWIPTGTIRWSPSLPMWTGTGFPSSQR